MLVLNLSLESQWWGETHTDRGADFDTTPALSIKLMPVCWFLFYFSFYHSIASSISGALGCAVIWPFFFSDKLISVAEGRSRRELIYMQPLQHQWNKKKKRKKTLCSCVRYITLVSACTAASVSPNKNKNMGHDKMLTFVDLCGHLSDEDRLQYRYENFAVKRQNMPSALNTSATVSKHTS